MFLRIHVFKKVYRNLNFYDGIAYKFKNFIDKAEFFEQFKMIVTRYKMIGYNMDILRQTACVVTNANGWILNFHLYLHDGESEWLLSQSLFRKIGTWLSMSVVGSIVCLWFFFCSAFRSPLYTLFHHSFVIICVSLWWLTCREPLRRPNICLSFETASEFRARFCAVKTGLSPSTPALSIFSWPFQGGSPVAVLHCSCVGVFTPWKHLYNFDPFKPHFYIVKLGFTGVYIIFLISAQKHRLWVFVRTASPRRF